jgi:hypothetical protein
MAAPALRDAAIVGRMTSLRHVALLLSTLAIFACGGSQKAPDAAASQSATPASTSASDDAKPKEAEAIAKPKEAEAASAPKEDDAVGCKKDADCTIFADCCACRAVLASKPPPVPCDAVCGESKCEVKGITIDNVACDAGKCVIKKKK